MKLFLFIIAVSLLLIGIATAKTEDQTSNVKPVVAYGHTSTGIAAIKVETDGSIYTL